MIDVDFDFRIIDRGMRKWFYEELMDDEEYEEIKRLIEYQRYVQLKRKIPINTQIQV